MLTIVTLVVTAQTTSFHYELACKGFDTEKAQRLVTYQKRSLLFYRPNLYTLP